MCRSTFNLWLSSQPVADFGALDWEPLWRKAADCEWETNFSSIPMLPVRRSSWVCYAARRSTMSSPYFTQSSSVVTRSGSQRALRTPAASLRSKLTNSQAENKDLVSPAAVKVEEEEARISGNVYVGYRRYTDTLWTSKKITPPCKHQASGRLSHFCIFFF